MWFPQYLPSLLTIDRWVLGLSSFLHWLCTVSLPQKTLLSRSRTTFHSCFNPLCRSLSFPLSSFVSLSISCFWLVRVAYERTNVTIYRWLVHSVLQPWNECIKDDHTFCHLEFQEGVPRMAVGDPSWLHPSAAAWCGESDPRGFNQGVPDTVYISACSARCGASRGATRIWSGASGWKVRVVIWFRRS